MVIRHRNQMKILLMVKEASVSPFFYYTPVLVSSCLLRQPHIVDVRSAGHEFAACFRYMSVLRVETMRIRLPHACWRPCIAVSVTGSPGITATGIGVQVQLTRPSGVTLYARRVPPLWPLLALQ